MERKIVELNTPELFEQLKLIGEVNALCVFKESNDLKTNKLNAELSHGNACRILIIEKELKNRFKSFKYNK